MWLHHGVGLGLCLRDMFDDNITPMDEVGTMTLGEIMSECETGHMLGIASWGDNLIVEVPNENVVAEEIALGCDGTFFADPDELTHAELDAAE